MAQTTKVRIIPAEQVAGLGIQAKIGIIIALLAVGIGVATAAYLYFQMRGTLTDEIEKRGRALASGLATSATNPILTNSKGVLKTIAEETRKEEAVDYVVILNDEAKSLFNTFEARRSLTRSPTPRKEPARPRPTGGTSNCGGIEILNVSAPVVEGKVGSVHIGMSTAGIAALVRNTIVVMLSVFAVVLAGAWGRRVHHLQPHHRLADSGRHVRRQVDRPGRPVPRSQGDQPGRDRPARRHVQRDGQAPPPPGPDGGRAEPDAAARSWTSSRSSPRPRKET